MASWPLTGSSHLLRQRQEMGESFQTKPARSALQLTSTGAWWSTKHQKSIRFWASCLIAFYRQFYGICWINPPCRDKQADRRFSVGCLACREMAFWGLLATNQEQQGSQAFWCKLTRFSANLMMKNKAPDYRGGGVYACALQDGGWKSLGKMCR